MAVSLTTGAVLWAGFVATVLAAVWYWLVRAVGLTSFSPTVQLGCLVLRDPRGPVTETTGLVLFLALGSSLIAVIYAGLMRSMGDVSWSAGAIIGVIHGFLFVALLPVLGMADACVRSGRAPRPGRWGLHWGRPTPVAVVVGHALYGAVLAAVLGAF